MLTGKDKAWVDGYFEGYESGKQHKKKMKEAGIAEKLERKRIKKRNRI